MQLICIFWTLSLSFVILASECHGAEYSVVIDSLSNRLHVVDSIRSSALVTGSFVDSYLDNGWSKFQVATTNVCSSHNDSICAYAAGFLEGFVTSDYIWKAKVNLFMDWGYGNSNISEYIVDYMNAQMAFLREEIANNSNDDYWIEIGLIYQQFLGLVDGYNSIASSHTKLSQMELFVINSAGDMEDLIGGLLVKAGKDAKFAGSSRERLRAMGLLDKNGYLKPFSKKDVYPDDKLMVDCSSMIKVLSDNSDVYCSHSTWRSFSHMIRIYKFYNFVFYQSFSSGIKNCSVSFASSPGFLSSKDDYYALSTGLVTMETTNSILNTSLYHQLSPQTVPVWFRTIAANFLAQNGSHWTFLFAKYNSGTYNNQWMVFDYKLFSPGLQKLSDNSLWILEQIPGQTQSGDVTFVLNNQGYWPSYNVPYFVNIFNASGYPAYVEQYGNAFTYDKNPRANIFRRDQANVTDITNMQRIMRYNNYQNDPLSLNDPANAVASRYDLRTNKGAAFGAIDNKLTSFALFSKNLATWAVNGPTDVQQPSFRWSTSGFTNTSHVGQPDLFDFPYVYFENENGI